MNEHYRLRIMIGCEHNFMSVETYNRDAAYRLAGRVEELLDANSCVDVELVVTEYEGFGQRTTHPKPGGG